MEEILCAQPWILISKKLYNQLERVQRRDTHAQSQPLKNKLSEGGFQELSEKAESDYYSVEIFYIGRKKQTCDKRRDSSALLTKA